MSEKKRSKMSMSFISETHSVNANIVPQLVLTKIWTPTLYAHNNFISFHCINTVRNSRILPSLFPTNWYMFWNKSLVRFLNEQWPVSHVWNEIVSIIYDKLANGFKSLRMMICCWPAVPIITSICVRMSFYIKDSRNECITVCGGSCASVVQRAISLHVTRCL